LFGNGGGSDAAFMQSQQFFPVDAALAAKLDPVVLLIAKLFTLADFKEVALEKNP